MSHASHTFVVGAGIVGLCCAIELRRRGLPVTVLDRLEPGHGCSWGNAGILSARSVVPIGMPGMLRRLPQMLFGREGPLVIRWRSLPHTARWLWLLQRSATLAQVRRTARAMNQLYGSSVELHRALAHEAGVPELVSAAPGLYVHRDATGTDLQSLAWSLRREHGAHLELLEGAALHEAEPELSPDYRRGLRMGPMGHTVNPLRLTQAYAALLQRMGGSIVRGELRALQPTAEGVSLFTEGATLQADAVVLAAGAWTAPLLRPLGWKLPLIAERGYHLSFAEPGLTLKHVVSEGGAHVAVGSMEGGLRIAGTEEIGLADDAPAWHRAELLRGIAQRMFPKARLGQASRWMGPRPGTPDSLPLIGALPGQPRLYVAAGHGHLGLTGAPHTGQLIAALLCGEMPGIDLAPYAPGRFGS
jgi:D-amino-acid dehydrogenase